MTILYGRVPMRAALSPRPAATPGNNHKKLTIRQEPYAFPGLPELDFTNIPSYQFGLHDAQPMWSSKVRPRPSWNHSRFQRAAAQAFRRAAEGFYLP